jgi:RNA polymerase sigma factor (TIGR02999 family)
VHEAYLKLIDGSRAPVRSRAYFFGAASRAMRQVLVDAARRRNREKRGGGVAPVPLDLAPDLVDETAEELLELDRALARLAESHPRPARVLECRFFGGLSVPETAEVVEVTGRTVQRDWDFARAWLRRELGRVVEPAEEAERPAR